MKKYRGVMFFSIVGVLLLFFTMGFLKNNSEVIENNNNIQVQTENKLNDEKSYEIDNSDDFMTNRKIGTVKWTSKHVLNLSNTMMGDIFQLVDNGYFSWGIDGHSYYGGEYFYTFDYNGNLISKNGKGMRDREYIYGYGIDSGEYNLQLEDGYYFYDKAYDDKNIFEKYDVSTLQWVEDIDVDSFCNYDSKINHFIINNNILYVVTQKCLYTFNVDSKEKINQVYICEEGNISYANFEINKDDVFLQVGISSNSQETSENKYFYITTNGNIEEINYESNIDSVISEDTELYKYGDYYYSYSEAENNNYNIKKYKKDITKDGKVTWELVDNIMVSKKESSGYIPSYGFKGKNFVLFNEKYIKICKNCNTENDKNNKYCYVCGKELAEMQEEPKYKIVMIDLSDFSINEYDFESGYEDPYVYDVRLECYKDKLLVCNQEFLQIFEISDNKLNKICDQSRLDFFEKYMQNYFGPLIKIRYRYEGLGIGGEDCLNKFISKDDGTVIEDYGEEENQYYHSNVDDAYTELFWRYKLYGNDIHFNIDGKEVIVNDAMCINVEDKNLEILSSKYNLDNIPYNFDIVYIGECDGKDIYIFETDKNGNVNWYKIYNKDELKRLGIDVGYCFTGIARYDNRYYCCTYSGTIVKMDINGNILGYNDDLKDGLGYGYKAISRTDDGVAAITEDGIIVSYVFKEADMGEVEVNYLEAETNKVLAEQEKSSGFIGQQYESFDKIDEINEKYNNAYFLLDIEGKPIGTYDIEKQVVTYYYQKKPALVIIKYVDIDTNEEIYESKIKSGKIDDEYTTVNELDNINIKYNNQYEYVKVDGNESGNMTEDVITVTYYYQKKPTSVITKYIDIDTNEEIYESKVQEGKINDEYTTVNELDNINIKYNNKYNFVKSTDNTSGIMEKDQIEVIYYYSKKDGNVVVKYKDIDTNEELASTENISGKVDSEYKTVNKLDEINQKNSNKYSFVKVDGEELGKIDLEVKEIIYYYQKISSNIIIRYIDDETGKEIIQHDTVYGNVGDKYETEPKEFEGYTLVETKIPLNKNGNFEKETIEVIYYYNKVKDENVNTSDINIYLFVSIFLISSFAILSKVFKNYKI